MAAFKILSLLSLFLYSTVSAATVTSSKSTSCGMQHTPVCSDIHRSCNGGLFLGMTNNDPALDLHHVPMPGNEAMYQSKDTHLTVQVSNAGNFVGRSTVKLQSSNPSAFDASIILVGQDGTAHGYTYKLPAKAAGDVDPRHCLHQLPQGFHAENVQMAQAV